ncbi:hypothetical protein Fraau_0958 [Frateuria aurantia DSM 6220]|uniref:Uncharacterized protein n=1 Tax=Frateuria aurantia (strain ATCC 33424 / DSM 6220 / KCTC 2777 / LMG 1558 / NBRC 3245 / NCIMB 13370) TaxID=767434 RepID=H8L1R6_FRAAD|nr:hypothetical protein Fraau_0958 [Frateuria aurantia DSM 6220]
MAIDNSVPTIDMFQPLDGWFDSRLHRVRVKVLNGKPNAWCRRNCVGDAAGECSWAPQFKQPWLHFPDIPPALNEMLTTHIAAR